MEHPFLVKDNTLNLKELIRALRLDIRAEEDAIITYDCHKEATEDSRVKAILQEIINDERKHVSQLQEMIMMLDPTEIEMQDEGLKENLIALNLESEDNE
jgi:rubrerythrin